MTITHNSSRASSRKGIDKYPAVALTFEGHGVTNTAALADALRHAADYIEQHITPRRQQFFSAISTYTDARTMNAYSEVTFYVGAEEDTDTEEDS